MCADTYLSNIDEISEME